jgi:EmrB/QacA subfamily drug resistance transporter
MIMKIKDPRWLALIIVLTAPLLGVIDVFIINVAIPAIREGIHANESEVQLVIASYLLGYAVFLITGGRFGDHFGKKKVFLWGMALFTLTSCWCGLSHSALEMDIARFFQGVSAAFMTPQTISYIQILFPTPKDRAKALGWFGVTLGLASMLGQFLGGFLTYYHFFIPGWRLIFFINLPVGMLSVIAAGIFLKETTADSSKKFDVSGVLLLTAALFALILPLVFGRDYGWPWWCFCILGFSILLFWLFLHNQNKKMNSGGSPLINPKLFGYRDFNLGLLSATCTFVVHNSYLLITTLLFQNGFHLNAFVTGKLFVLFGLGFTVSSLSSIKLFQRFGKIIVQLAALLMLISIGLQSLLFTSSNVSELTIGICLIFQGLSAGGILPSVLNLTLKSVPGEFAGAASGLYSTVQQGASALGVSLIGSLFFTMLNHQKDTGSFQQAFKYGAYADMVALALLTICLMILPGKVEEKEPRPAHISE